MPNPTPQLPIPQVRLPEQLSKCWTIFYRHGVNATLTKNFFFDGTMKEAIERAQQHCQTMGYKYHFIRQMLSDIEHEESVQLGKVDLRTGKMKEPVTV